MAWIYFLLFLSCWTSCEALSRYVLVSVAPYKYFTERIAGDTVQVGLMVPAGASAHTYEPTPKEMIAASHADAWFTIGESFEDKASRAIQNHHPDIKLIDLKQGVDLLGGDHNHHCCCHAHCQDLHIWLSPRRAAIQARTLAEGLSSLYPENRELYQQNLGKLIEDLKQLDQQIASELQPLKQRWFMVSHPAYGYFASDYQLKQLSIEFEGKDPTPRQLTQVLETAKEHQIRTIFIQMQYSNKGARLIADILKAKVVNLDPYSEHYLSSMRDIAHQIAISGAQ